MNQLQPPKRPRWVIVLGVAAAAVIVVLVVVALMTNGHSPGRHM